MPFPAETIRGYLEAVHQLYLTDPAVKTTVAEARPLARIELRHKYNQNFESITRWCRAREGTRLDRFVTPVTRIEFLVG